MKISMAIASLVSLCLAGCMGNTPNHSKPLPQRSDYADQTEFLSARIAYYTEEWVQEHPDKPWHYRPGQGLWDMGDGVWSMETGPAVTSGHGLLVTVDDSGELIEIQEIFNPE